MVMYNNDKFDLQVLKINTESNQTTVIQIIDILSILKLVDRQTYVNK